MKIMTPNNSAQSPDRSLRPGAVMLVIQTRLHRDDLTGRIMQHAEREQAPQEARAQQNGGNNEHAACRDEAEHQPEPVGTILLLAHGYLTLEMCFRNSWSKLCKSSPKMAASPTARETADRRAARRRVILGVYRPRLARSWSRGVVLEEKVALQPQELVGRRLAPPADELGDRDPTVVVADPPRNAAEELKRPAVPFLERLRAFPRKHLAEEGVAEWQRDHEVGDFGLLPLQKDDRFAEVGLGLARGVRQRHEHLGRAGPPGTHGVADHTDPALVTALAPQSIEDPLDRMTLLGRGLLVLLENLMDYRQEPIELGLGPRLTLLIARRFRVAEDLVQRLPVQVVLCADRSLALLLGQYQATDFGPEMHV